MSLGADDAGTLPAVGAAGSVALAGGNRGGRGSLPEARCSAIGDHRRGGNGACEWAAINAILYLRRTGCLWRHLQERPFSAMLDGLRKFQRDGVSEAF